MRIPKKYQDKVDSLKKNKDDEFNHWNGESNVTYEVNLNDDYTYDGSHLHYCSTYKEALTVMKFADKEKNDEEIRN